MIKAYRYNYNAPGSSGYGTAVEEETRIKERLEAQHDTKNITYHEVPFHSIKISGFTALDMINLIQVVEDKKSLKKKIIDELKEYEYVAIFTDDIIKDGVAVYKRGELYPVLEEDKDYHYIQDPREGGNVAVSFHKNDIGTIYEVISNEYYDE